MNVLGRTIPALPVREAAAAVAHYRDRLGFEVVHQDEGFAVLRRDEAVVHLWQADDETWRDRGTIARPVRSGHRDRLRHPGVRRARPRRQPGRVLHLGGLTAQPSRDRTSIVWSRPGPTPIADIGAPDISSSAVTYA